MPPERLVTLCVVNYQGSKHLPTALLAASRSTLAFGEILVVDNASSDGSVSWLRSQYPEIRVLELDANLGPAGARNAGFEAAVHDLILFQDNDVQLDARVRGSVARNADRIGARPARRTARAVRGQSGARAVRQRRLPFSGTHDDAQCESSDAHASDGDSRHDVTRDRVFSHRPRPVASRSAVRRMVWLQLRGSRLRCPRQRSGLRVARCAGRTCLARQRDGEPVVPDRRRRVEAARVLSDTQSLVRNDQVLRRTLTARTCADPRMLRALSACWRCQQGLAQSMDRAPCGPGGRSCHGCASSGRPCRARGARAIGSY